MDKPFPIHDQIEMLGSALRGRIVTPGHADYEAMRQVAMYNFDRLPRAIIRVANAADVAAVINFARATDLPLAIRSGGHSTIGASGCDDGLVIDLRDLNAIDIDAEARTAWCGAGLTAGEVSRAVEQHNLIVGFGDSASVGVGGLTLGGGLGYMLRKHGLTIDVLLAAEIVTANGDILTVDADHHPDLFWALRGGGGNFGVVTRLKFRLHPLAHFTGGPLILPATPEVLAAFARVSAEAPETVSTIGMVMPLPPMPFVPEPMHGQLALVGMLAYSGDAAGAQAALAPFRAIATPIADLVREAPYSSMYALDPPPDVRPAVAVRSRFIRQFGLAEATAMLDAMARCDAPMKMGQIRVLGGAFGRVDADATAFAHRGAGYMATFLAMYGGGPEVTAAQERWASEALAALNPGNGGAYVNFLGNEGATGLSAAYPAQTLARLQAVKHRYDPENLFRLNQNIKPAA